MNKTDWIKYLLSGGKGTSNRTKQNKTDYIMFDNDNFVYTNGCNADMAFHTSDFGVYTDKTEYPIYAKCLDGDGTFIVKFIGLKIGFVVEQGDAERVVGSFHDDWKHHTDENTWKILPDYKEVPHITVAPYLLRSSSVKPIFRQTTAYFETDQDLFTALGPKTFYKRLDLLEIKIPKEL